MLDKGETREVRDGNSSAAWIAAAWVSFLIWLFHSFAVRAFFDSLHGAGKVLGGR
jgi:hypothetical protein